MMDFEIQPKVIELGTEGEIEESIYLDSKDIASYESEESKEKRKDI